MLKKIVIFVSILVVIFAAVVYIDYFLVKNKGYLPKISIKQEDSVKQSTIYKSFFYKVIKCNVDNSIIISNYNTDDDVCPRDVKYVDGFFTNSSGLKISKKNYILMSYLNIYTFNNIDKMTTNQEVTDAVYVSYNYGNNKYIIKENSEFEHDGEEVKLAVFQNFDESDYSFKIDESIKEKIKCTKKNDDDIYVFSDYDLENKTCKGEFKKITMDKKWCDLYKNSTLIYSIDNENKYCE